MEQYDEDGNERLSTGDSNNEVKNTNGNDDGDESPQQRGFFSFFAKEELKDIKN